MNQFVEDMCAHVGSLWPVTLSKAQESIRDAARGSRLAALVEAAQYLRDKHYQDAAAELTVLITIELQKEQP